MPAAKPGFMLTTAAASQKRLGGITSGLPAPTRTVPSIVKPVTRKPLAPVNTAKTKKPMLGKAPTSSTQSLGQKRGMNSSTTSVNSSCSSVAAKKPAKRPGWDLKGRVSDMEDLISQLTTELRASRTNYEKVSTTSEVVIKEKTVLESKHNDLVAECERMRAKVFELDELRLRHEDTNDRLKRLQKKFSEMEEELESVSSKYTKLLAESKQDKEDLEDKTAKLNKVTTKLAVSEDELAVATQKCSSLERQNCEFKEKITAHENSILDSRNELAICRNTINELTEEKKLHDKIRRQLHNAVQELKGNIRVFCRVRPLLPSEKNVAQAPIDCDKIDCKSLKISERGTSVSGETSLKDFEFQFDHVFSSETRQGEVFEEISQLVQSALDGYNVCVFAYGQTGSGKTFTMEGQRDWCPHDDTFETRGMIPRSLEALFERMQEMKAGGWESQVRASFLEIYNESIYDLLDSSSKPDALEIKQVGKDSGDVHVAGAKQIELTSVEHFYSLLQAAQKSRHVAETKVNRCSSRSHCLFQLHISCQNRLQDERHRSTLSIVDLAGSERCKDSGSVGDRFKEANAINQSLSNLGNVITALAQKSKHVPFRNSKLTYLLKNCLGGSNKTLMFVNISPRAEFVSESLNSLRFATKVNNCNIGTASKQIVK